MLDILIPCSDRFQFHQCRVRYAICYQQQCSHYLQLLSSNKVWCSVLLLPGPYSAYFVTVVYTVWVQKVHVGGVFMEVFAAEDLTLVLYQKLEYSIPISRYTLYFKKILYTATGFVRIDPSWNCRLTAALVLLMCVLLCKLPTLHLDTIHNILERADI